MRTRAKMETGHKVETKGLQTKVAQIRRADHIIRKLPTIFRAFGAKRLHSFFFCGFFFPLPRGKSVRARWLKQESIAVALTEDHLTICIPASRLRAIDRVPA